jgi:hypothetical protein
VAAELSAARPHNSTLRGDKRPNLFTLAASFIFSRSRNARDHALAFACPVHARRVFLASSIVLTFNPCAVLRRPWVGAHFMDIILPLAIGLAVACAIFALCRIFVGSGSAPQKLATSASANIIDEARASREALSFVDHRDFIEDPEKVKKQSAAQSQKDVVKAPPRPRRRKAREATVPGPDGVQ